MHVRDRFQHIFVPWTVELAAMLEMRLDLSSESRLRFCVFSGEPADACPQLGVRRKARPEKGPPLDPKIPGSLAAGAG